MRSLIRFPLFFSSLAKLSASFSCRIVRTHPGSVDVLPFAWFGPPIPPPPVPRPPGLMSCYIGRDAQRAAHWPPSHALGSHPPPVLLRVGTAAVMVAAVAAVLAHRFSSSFVSAFDTVGHNSMNERASASCMCSVESFLSRTSSSRPMPSLLIFMDMILLVSCLVFCSHSEVPCAHLSFLPSFLPSLFVSVLAS